MNNLECLKLGFHKYICKHYNKEIKLSQCKNCPYKKYKNVQYNVKNCKKTAKMHNKIQNTVQIKVAKLEAEEQSILEQTQQMNSRLDSLTKEIHQMQRKLKK